MHETRHKKRFLIATSASIAMLFSAATANALVVFTVTTTSPPGAQLFGDEITFNIRISSTGSPAVRSVGAAVFGYDSNMFDFVSGQAVGSFLHETCLPAVGCFQGLDNSAGGALIERYDALVGPFVQLATASSTSPTIGTGALDPGLDGVVGGGDAQFRVTFRLVSPGSTTFTIGTWASHPTLGFAIIAADGTAFDAANASTSFWVPEPGTALLLGLGLAGLSAARGRDLRGA